MGRSVWLVGVALTLLLSILGVSVGCGESPPVDTSLLTGEPCEPPCWQGLTPGLSTEEQVNEFLRTSPFVQRTTIYRGSVTRGAEIVGVSIDWLSTANVQGARAINSLHVEDGVLQDIIVYLDSGATLEELLEVYGLPDGISAGRTGVESTRVDVVLLYPEHGFIAFLSLPAHDPSLQPDSRLSWLWYFRAAPLDRFLELAREAGFFSGSVDVESFRNWEGYGPIQLN
jgi:hypothetical protein